MNELLIVIIVLGAMLLVSLIGLLTALFRGEMKKFIVEKMGEAEAKYPKTVEGYQALRRNYVIDAFAEKYKLLEFMLNVKVFIEKVIAYSKTINYK